MGQENESEENSKRVPYDPHLPRVGLLERLRPSPEKRATAPGRPSSKRGRGHLERQQLRHIEPNGEADATRMVLLDLNPGAKDRAVAQRRSEMRRR